MHTKRIISSLWNCTLRKTHIILTVVNFILSSMNFVTYEILDRCPNDWDKVHNSISAEDEL